MITGDIHGHRRNFNRIAKTAALDAHPRRHLILQEVCHGGPTYSEQRRLHVAHHARGRRPAHRPHPGRVHFLLSNHELAEMTEYPIQKNKKMLNLLFRLGLQQIYGPATDRVREAMVSFLQSCPLGAWMPDRVLVTHSIPEKAATRPFDRTIFTRRLDTLEYFERTSIFDLLWGRNFREENAQAFARLMEADVFINGHEPCPEGFDVPNSFQVVLDCSGDKARYVILSPNRPWTQAEIVARIKPLDGK